MDAVLAGRPSMSEHDSDIEFDFFDEPETGESAAPDRTCPSHSVLRAGRRSGPPERRGIPPTARLAGLIAFGILIVVLLVLWVQSCSSTSKKSSYEHYLDKVAPLALDSNRAGEHAGNRDRDAGDQGRRAREQDGPARAAAAGRRRGRDEDQAAVASSSRRTGTSSPALQLRTDGLVGAGARASGRRGLDEGGRDRCDPRARWPVPRRQRRALGRALPRADAPRDAAGRRDRPRRRRPRAS